ncbi:hypothetical protein [Nonomuraea endophytica]|uniref:Uncharacterized protein n=1 Tax=Nonomuraea endophytica TaxID=714136 RepID=A0A7W8EJL8_9ACTN|nr:hypothetical protein [Nonomuraea endophytica]MBB5080817.1 hypothetical protein [Nonomuraea endophytica]
MGLQRLTTVLTILLVGGSSALPSAPSATQRPPLSPKERRESLMADCMKRHGFRYVQDVQPQVPLTKAQRGMVEGDYSAMLADRLKYGFRIFARYVFPNETGPNDVAGFREHPNNATINALSRTQAEAYFKAQAPCYAWAAQTALGRKVTSVEDLDRQVTEALHTAHRQAHDADPLLVAKARDFAACMAAKGRPVADPRPSQIAGETRKPLFDQLWELGRRQWPRMKGDVLPELTRFEAAPYFREERQAALDDLECGKDFYRLFFPRSTAVGMRVAWEWGEE